ncbi:MAG: FtsW/RodA/SpoVE family cell cycle protein [Lachnospiraceae bacterium]|nr:FtsW/RodA/SpoVE family cell cycle protein [Lachnospiraceae bacterium]
MLLILDVLFLNLFGIIMIYSASYYPASKDPDISLGAYHYLAFQTAFVLVGIVGMLLVAYLRPGFWKTIGYFMPWIFYLLALMFLFSVRIPGLGIAVNGARRWIRIGPVTLQVAEPIKVLMILFMASVAMKGDITKKPTVYLLFISFGIMAALLWKISNNMSTAIVLGFMMFFTVMINYPKQKWFWILLGVGMIGFLLYCFVYVDRMLPYDPNESFRITRIRAWMHMSDPQFVKDQAYQANQALYAIASGGFFGKGLGHSLIKYMMPEPHNDYILAIVFEELGIFGVIVLTGMFVYLLYRIARICRESDDTFSRILCMGVFFHIAFQVLINYAVTLGIIPTTGVTLTFISAGGTAALFTLAELGLVLAVDRENKEKALYRDAVNDVRTETPEYEKYQKYLEDTYLAEKETGGRIKRFLRRIRDFFKRLFFGIFPFLKKKKPAENPEKIGEGPEETRKTAVNDSNADRPGSGNRERPGRNAGGRSVNAGTGSRSMNAAGRRQERNGGSRRTETGTRTRTGASGNGTQNRTRVSEAGTRTRTGTSGIGTRTGARTSGTGTADKVRRPSAGPGTGSSRGESGRNSRGRRGLFSKKKTDQKKQPAEASSSEIVYNDNISSARRREAMQRAESFRRRSASAAMERRRNEDAERRSDHARRKP